MRWLRKTFESGTPMWLQNNGSGPLNCKILWFSYLCFDLTDPDDLERMVQFIEESADSILGIWIAPSCGTCSRAREERLVSLERAGVKTPIPLRSLLQPDQLDGLTGLDKVKVEKANMLYDAVYVLASLACSLHIFVGIENPTNSHYWSTTPMRKLCDEQGHHYVTFHNCAHGGDRDKSTSLWVNDDWLDSLAILCDKRHSHKSWTTKLAGGGSSLRQRKRLPIQYYCVNA